MIYCSEKGELYGPLRAPFIGPQTAVFYLKDLDSYLIIAKKGFTLHPRVNR